MFDPIPVRRFCESVEHNALACKFCEGVEYLVPLKMLIAVSSIQIMPLTYLRMLLGYVPLGDVGKEYPYRSRPIDVVSMNPKPLEVCQTFVQRDKCLNFISSTDRVAEPFAVPNGLLKLGAFIAYGSTETISCAMAHYLPPIVELHTNGSCILLDGVHRGYVHLGIGADMPVVTIRNVSASFPCDTSRWSRVRQVDVKPPLLERYPNLKMELFRNVSAVGIDG